VDDAQALTKVMKEIGARAHQTVNLSLSQEIGYELAKAGWHHGPCQAKEYRHILIQHALPNPQGGSELASLKAHSAHIPYQIGYTPVLHGYGSPRPLAVADKIMTMTVIHFIPLKQFSL
jgi:hypothetical protein